MLALDSWLGSYIFMLPLNKVWTDHIKATQTSAQNMFMFARIDLIFGEFYVAIP